MIDPVVAIVARAALAVLLLAAGLHKLRAPHRFREAAVGYLPGLRRWPRLGEVARIATAAGEILLAGALALAAVRPGREDVAMAAGTAAAGLLGLYAVLIAQALGAGRGGFDCGCGGLAARRQTVGWPLVARNLLLAGAAGVAAAPAATRPLSVFDALTAALALAATALLYAAAETALALPAAPLLPARRRGR